MRARVHVRERHGEARRHDGSGAARIGVAGVGEEQQRLRDEYGGEKRREVAYRDTAFAFDRTWEMEDGSPVNVGRMTMSTHSGTHADAPLHYAADGADAAQMSLDPYLGTCIVVDARGVETDDRSDRRGRFRPVPQPGDDG